MLIVTLFIMTQIWKQLKCASPGEDISCGTSTEWNTTQQRKGTNSRHMQQQGRISSTFCYVKETRLKRVPSI